MIQGSCKGTNIRLLVDKLALARRFHSFFGKTSCSMALSSDMFAMIRVLLLKLPRPGISDGIRQAYFLRQSENVGRKSQPYGRLR